MAKPPPIPFFILNGHEGNISTLQFHNETDEVLKITPTLFSGSEIGEIFIWNLKSFRTLFRLSCPEKTTILFLHYYKSKLISQNKTGTINFWVYNNNEWNVARKLRSSVGFCSSYFWTTSEDTNCLGVMNQDRYHIYDIDKVEEIKEISVNSSSGLCMCAKVVQIKNNWYLLAGYENGNVALHDTSGELSAGTFHKDILTCLDFDSEHKGRGISGSVDQVLAVWRIDDNLQLRTVSQIELPNPGTNAVKIRSDGKIVVTAGVDNFIRVFSWKTLKPLAILGFHEHSVQSVTFSLTPVNKKSSVFASGSKDKNIALWSIY